MIDLFREWWTWPVLVAAVGLLLSVTVSGHAILHKRDTRAAIAWAGLIWLTPFLGSFLYLTLGINRIRRRAHLLRRVRPATAHRSMGECDPGQLEEALRGQLPLGRLARLVGELTGHPLLSGNDVQPLVMGDNAYPAMLQAIGGARYSISLASYIFDVDHVGQQFVAALAAAHDRGVAVRVLIDDVGARYSSPPATQLLSNHGLSVARFLPAGVRPRFRYSNLRNHRKVLVVDGEIGFTGGMNIREGNLGERSTRNPIQDVHFRVLGPVVGQIQEAFAIDWAFTTGERLEGSAWFPEISARGPVLARGIADGPDEDFDKLRWTILGALGCAQQSILVITPYFLPDTSLITALNIAVLRGVTVDIVLPAKSNLALVQWASTALLWQVLQRGCRVWAAPPPFDHSKLLIVDERWCMFGSANWDPRSLRLNFELNVECYDADLATRMAALAREKLAKSRPITLAEVDGRSLPRRLRDGMARLLTPYL